MMSELEACLGSGHPHQMLAFTGMPLESEYARREQGHLLHDQDAHLCQAVSLLHPHREPEGQAIGPSKLGFAPGQP